MDRCVLDLGCGPGLYANALAERGAWVHGIDLSAASIAEARRRATTPRVRFEVGDYLDDALPEHDLALLIYGDLCAMAPVSRHRLLERYVIVQPERARTVHCWLAHLTPAEVERELAQAGFAVLELLGDLTGAPYDPDAELFALVTAPR